MMRKLRQLAERTNFEKLGNKIMKMHGIITPRESKSKKRGGESILSVTEL